MLTRIIIRLLANTLTLYILDIFLKNIEIQGSWKAYLLAGVILGIINISVKPLLKIFTFPLTVVTLGLFIFVINFIVIYLMKEIINALQISDIHIIISTWKDYFITAIVFTLLNGIIHSLAKT